MMSVRSDLIVSYGDGSMDDATYPNFRGKHAHDPFFTPEQYIVYAREHGFIPDFAVPDGVVLCYSRSLLDRISAIQEVTPIKGVLGEFYLIDRTAGRVGVIGKFGIGAPAVTTIL